MASEPMFSERHRQPRGIGKEFVKGVKGAATGGIPAMVRASIQMGAAQVEGLSEPKTWYDIRGQCGPDDGFSCCQRAPVVHIAPDLISHHELAP